MLAIAFMTGFLKQQITTEIVIRNHSLYCSWANSYVQTKEEKIEAGSTQAPPLLILLPQ